MRLYYRQLPVAGRSVHLSYLLHELSNVQVLLARAVTVALPPLLHLHANVGYKQHEAPPNCCIIGHRHSTRVR